MPGISVLQGPWADVQIAFQWQYTFGMFKPRFIDARVGHLHRTVKKLHNTGGAFPLFF